MTNIKELLLVSSDPSLTHMKSTTNPMAQDSNRAIVFGAAGLLGWSAVNQLLSGYPTSRSFSRVTAVLNRSVPEAELHWPSEEPDRPQLQIVSGIDLLQGTGDDLAKQLKEKVEGVEQITHVFYFGMSAIWFTRLSSFA
jgi:nucleoside-diphosphate-sugar epimerase